MENDLGNDLHMLWALSKDFGASGFRVGVLYTQNKHIIRAMGNLNIFSSVSHPMQIMVSEMLKDETFVDSYLSTSRNLLQRSYNVVVKSLEEMNIPYIPAKAGIFLYCDFSSVLPPTKSDDNGGNVKEKNVTCKGDDFYESNSDIMTYKAERQLSSVLLKCIRLVMTPGECQRDINPGMFRICYAYVSIDVLIIGMKRLKEFIYHIRNKGWEGIDQGVSMV